MTAKRICSLCNTEYDADQKFCPNDGSPLRAAGQAEGLVGQIIADRYRVLSTLGEGGMGRVYLAEHVRMGRRCAVKVISPALATTDAAIARFNREAANASQINHPNVVQVYDFGEGPDHTLYLAMEYVQGETMSTIIRREGPIALRRAATMAKQVADALGAAHHHGIVHRDLKPDNILVTRQHDGSEWVKVVDFGIAKTVQPDGDSESHGGQTVTTVGVSIGTPEYMSPEQLAGERLDTRTDLYSLGLVFFNLLTSDLPYPRVTSRENLIRRLMTPPRTLREVRPNIDWPESLQAVLDRALASDVDQRYATASDFSRDLSALIAAAPPEPDVTVPMKVAGSAPAVPPTRAPAAATTAIDAKAPTVADPVPAAVGQKRKRNPVLIAVAAGVVVIAGGLYAFTQNRSAPTASTPASADSSTGLSTSLTSPVDSPATVVASHPPGSAADSTVRVPSQSAATVPADTSKPSSLPTTSSATKALAAVSPTSSGASPGSAATSSSSADSTPTASPALPLPQRIRQNLVLKHSYLRANGDSVPSAGLPLNAPVPARITAIQQEVDGHVALGRRHALRGQMDLARAQFREAVQEVGNVNMLLPNNPDAIRLRDSVSRSLRNFVTQCQVAMQRGQVKTSEPGFRCPTLVPARILGGRGRL